MADAVVAPLSSSAGAAVTGTCARNVAGAAIGGLLIATIEFAVTRGTVQFNPLEQGIWLVRLSLHWSLAALPLGVVLTWVERRRPGSGPSRLGYVLAVVTGATLGAVVVALHGKYVDPAITRTAVGLDLALEDRFLYGLWQLSFWGTVGAFLHAAELQRRRGVLSLQQGELARLHSEKRLADARLAALHAQVEPEFLLATLDTVERLYARDVTAADAVLDALIRFLREATPLLRCASSSLPQECRLLRLYLEIPGHAQAARLEDDVDVEPKMQDGPLPPGLLVSLTQAMLACVKQGVARVALEVDERRNEVRVTVMAPRIEVGPGLDERVSHARQRLEATRGAAGRISVIHDEEHGITLRVTLHEDQGGNHGRPGPA